ncbi:hypothetical protein [Lysobacter sp. GCM10012299]|uniref:hypothetical protein n=1 Tax=Lysobacter sp. GCM10012299 TaxID=3317333 RepID=UPI00360F0C20
MNCADELENALQAVDLEECRRASSGRKAALQADAREKGEAVVTDDMVDAYLLTQRRVIESEDCRPNAGGYHRDAVRDACRAGLVAALATQPAQASESLEEWSLRMAAKEEGQVTTAGSFGLDRTQPQPVTRAGWKVEPVAWDESRGFDVWWRENVAPGTIISSPDWWAVRIRRQFNAERARQSLNVGDRVIWGDVYGTNFPGVVTKVDSTRKYGIQLDDGCVVTNVPERCIAALDQRGGGDGN